MLKEGYDVTVYERTGKFARFGGPIQFASNALSTLKAIDERLFERVMSKFTFTGTRRCGIKDGLRADGSFRMTDVADVSYLWDDKVPADWFVEFPLKGCADFFKLPYTGVINRPDLQDILIDECRRLKPDFIENGAPVVGYENTDKGVTVKLEGGKEVEADLLIGSDGIWSAVRAQMYDEGEVKAPSRDGKTIQGCPYSGYTVFAGETVMKMGDYYDCGYKVYIGPGKYFVTSDVGDGRIQWYAFLGAEPGTKKAGDSWEGKGTSEGEGSDVISYLKGIHEGWSSEVFQVLDQTPAASVEQRDLYDRWPEFFRSWADGSTVLIGDAVHPMMPNLGQGGCQAIEDAYILTQAMKAANMYSRDGVPAGSLRTSLQDFYKQRMPRVAGVSLLSRLASDLIINAFDTPWSPHDEKGTDWKSYLTFLWKPLLQYVVFPAQFLFLYSYHPSGPMGDLPERLVEEWRERHVKSSQEAFDRVAREGQSTAGPSFFAKVEETVAASFGGERKE
jgi:zeaxanthin epoxidase